jgi:phenylacetate-CoA ligase
MLLRRFYYLPQVLKREWKNTEEIEKISFKMLRNLLKDVVHMNPFYKRKLKAVDSKRIRTRDNLSQIPFTTKDELRGAFPQNLSAGYKIEDCVHESTSGSAGDVLNIFHDQAAYDYYSAIGFREYAGYSYKLKYKISCIRFEPYETQLYERIGLFQRCFVPVTYPAERQLALLLKQNPHVISAYPSSLYEIAKLFEETNSRINLKFIISNSEVLTDHVRKYIESVFGCPVYNDYSSFEMHNIASECTHQRMHLHIDCNLVEIIKDGEEAAPGEKGEIVITNLRNRAMPFIQYCTGDYGVMSEEPCTCGRGLPLLHMVEGRRDEYLTLASGGRISPRIFDPLDFVFHPYVSKFQIIQKKKDEFVIKVVKKQNYSDQITIMLIEKAKKCFPEPIEVEIVPVEDIKRTGRGKLRAVINEVGT